MSAADRLEDGFPHGTPAGYQQGCRSNGACPSKRETGQSCKDANVRAARDSTYRVLVKSGAPVSVLAQPEVEAQKPSKPAAPRPAPHAATPKILQPKTPKATKVASLPDDTELGRTLAADLPDLDHRPVAEVLTERAPIRRRPGRPSVPLIHGTRSGYLKGCKDPNTCPGGPTGITCRDANNERSREYYQARQKAAALAAAPTEEAPSASTPPADTSSASPAPSSSTLPSPLAPSTVAESTPVAAPVAAPATPLPESDVTAAHSTGPEAPSMSSPTLPARSPSTEALGGNLSSTAADVSLLANVALAFGALEVEAPVHRTPFDGIPGIMADLLRVAWLDGFKARGRRDAP